MVAPLRFACSALALLGTIALLPATGFAQHPDAPAAIEALKAAVDTAERHPLAASYGSQLQSMRSSLARMTSAWIKAQGQDMNEDYVAFLRFDAQLLTSAFASRDSTASILEDVAEDLAYKAAEPAGGVGWDNPQKRGGIEVTVTARRGAVDVTGLLVRANPKRYEAAAPMFRSNGGTTSTMRLPAGKYYLLLEHPSSGQKIAAREITINSLESPKITIDVP